MKAGLAKRLITPPWITSGICLVGLREEKNRNAFSKLDDLFVKVAWLKDEKNCIIINADILFFTEEICLEISQWVRECFAVEKKFILFNATHTHSAPHLGGEFFEGGVKEPRYRKFFIERIKECINEAYESLKEARIFFGKTKCTIGVNRRKKILSYENIKHFKFRREVRNRPNPKKSIDDDLSIIKIQQEGEDIALFVNYSCHASTLIGPYISADFPGQIELSIKNKLKKDISVFFLQGFAGDIRPYLLYSPSIWRKPKYFLIQMIEGPLFKKNADETDIKKVGEEIAQKIISIPEDSFSEIILKINAKSKDIYLPFNNIPDLKFYQKTIFDSEPNRSWLSHIIDHYHEIAKIKLNLTVMELNPDHLMICISGEVFSDYALIFKKMFAPKTILPLGYTNGMTGYIPTHQALLEGGYEVERSYKLFGWPCPLSGDIEKSIIKSVQDLVYS